MNARDQDHLSQFAAALDRLTEALAVDRAAPLAVDGSIQRFEFTFRLAWKAAKRALAAEGVEAASPRDVLKTAYAIGWIGSEAEWLGMLKDRNLSSHTYFEPLANALYARLPAHRDALAALLVALRGRLSA